VVTFLLVSRPEDVLSYSHFYYIPPSVPHHFPIWLFSVFLKRNYSSPDLHKITALTNVAVSTLASGLRSAWGVSQLMRGRDKGGFIKQER